MYGFLRYCCRTLCTVLHAVYGLLFMQTNAANDQLGSTGTATARAEMLLQSLQRHKAATMACFSCQGMAGLVSYMPLAHPRPALQQVFGGVQDYQTVAKIVARLVHATQPTCSSLFCVYRIHTRRRLLCLRVLIATLAVARSRNRTVLQIAVRARDLQQKWH